MTFALVFEPGALEQMRSFNRKLAWAPRFKISNRVMPFMIQSLLRLSQLAPDLRTLRTGVRIAQRVAQTDELRVPVRVLRGDRPPRAVILDFHGGGWAIGNAQMNDQLNAELIGACDVAVVSVDYRLATNTSLAAIMDDCLAAARWLLDGGLPEYDELPVYVLGESAGGHLAAATLLQLQRWPALLRRIDGAILYYGVYDLAGLPPAIMFAGERDPLLDDTTSMATRWGAVTDVECHLVPEAPHGFIRFPVRIAAQVRGRVHAWINDRVQAAKTISASDGAPPL